MFAAFEKLSVFPATYGKRVIVILCAWLVCSVAVPSVTGEEERGEMQGVEYLFPREEEEGGADEAAEKQAKRQATLLKKLKSIEAGEPVDATDKYGQTALMYAAAVGNRLAVCWLVAKGADVTLKNQKGTTAEDLAGDPATRGILSACASEKKPITGEEEPERARYRSVPARSLEGLSKYANLVRNVRFGASFSAIDPVQTNILTAKLPPEGLAFLLRHGLPVTQHDIDSYGEATPEQIRLLLALGIPRQTDEAGKELSLKLLLDDMPGIRSTLEQHPDLAKNAEYYGYAQSGEAVQTLRAAAGSPPNFKAASRGLSAGRIGAPALRALLDIESGLADNEEAIGKYVDRDRIEHIGILLEHDLAPNYFFTSGESMLHRAVGQCSPEVVRLLLKAGADPNSRDRERRTPLMQAGKTPDDVEEMRELIRSGANVNAQDCHGNTPLIFLLTRSGDLRERMQVLIDAKADVNACTNLGTSALMMACFCSDPQQRLACSRFLLEHGAKIDAQDAGGRTAVIRLLQQYDDPPTLEFLLNAGANIKLRTKENKSALFTARERKRAKCVEMLLTHGAADEDDFTKTDKKGRTPLMRAALDKNGLEILRSLICNSGDVNARDKEGRTALHLLIAEDGDIRARMLELIDAKANVNLAANDGTTPLMMACRYKQQIKRIFRVRQLLAAMADPNVQDAAGFSAAMHLVSAFDDAETLAVLLDAHASIDAENKEGETLLSIARQHKRAACTKLLEARGAKEPSFFSTLGSSTLIVLAAAVLLGLLLLIVIFRRK